MSYVDRMCARLLLPSFLPLAVAIPIATVADALSALPSRLGGAPAWPNLATAIMGVGALASVGYFAIQAIRIARWRHGRGATCYVCGCLLGHTREGRWGPYRRCLGCTQGHSV